MTTESQVSSTTQVAIAIQLTVVILEGAGDITALAGPESHGDPPVAGVGVRALDILRDLASVKPPEGDLRVVPEHSENATATGVEWTASTPLEIGHGTTSVTATRAQALSTEGSAEVTLWLRTVLISIISGGIRV